MNPADCVLVPRSVVEAMAYVRERPDYMEEAVEGAAKALRRRAPTHIKSPADAYRLLAPRIGAADVEHFVIIVLDSQSHVLAVEPVTQGVLNASLVHPREIFRTAMKHPVAGIIVAHNHPSGDPTPSADDRAATRQLTEAGRVLDIPVYDHVVIGAGRYVSFAEAGLL